ncbi:fibroblast growth factor receptor 1-like isoform X1 [Patella vulgata]|uniref:fibroblast growth factor receptor 1-like isoform X1 n=1 Tax=Patella vulgata TaxID=6465 RepID=UPI0024A97B75|nr:fibroblast growth factor receptor 1-like isoform X1 [Patella vulgata]
MSTGRLYILFSLLTITTFIDVDAEIVARATCDDDMYFYADGVLMANHSNWGIEVEIDLPDNTIVIGVHCVDIGGFGGIYVTFTLNQTYTTDTSWKCSAKFEENWSTPEFEDGNWDAASIANESLHRRTDWIWTSGYLGEDTDVYCRKKIQDQPIIRKLTSDVVDNIIDENSSVTINCLVESIPAARVSWSRSQQGGQLYSGSQYTIPKASCQHTDNYTCTASNNIGQPVSKTIPLYVRCTPIVLPTDFIVVPHGETGIISINVLAYPLPVFVWYYHQQDGSQQPVTMVTGTRSKQTDDGLSSRLTIRDITYEDWGNYTVNIINSLGVTSKTYTLSVISNGDAVKEAVDDKLGVGIAIGLGIGLVISGVLFVIIWCIKKRRDAIMSNDRNGVNDTVGPQSRNITTRHGNSPVDTGDSVKHVNTLYTSTSSDYEGLDELTMDHRPNIYLPLSNKRQGH